MRPSRRGIGCWRDRSRRRERGKHIFRLGGNFSGSGSWGVGFVVVDVYYEDHCSYHDGDEGGSHLLAEVEAVHSLVDDRECLEEGIIYSV